MKIIGLLLFVLLAASVSAQDTRPRPVLTCGRFVRVDSAKDIERFLIKRHANYFSDTPKTPRWTRTSPGHTFPYKYLEYSEGSVHAVNFVRITKIPWNTKKVSLLQSKSDIPEGEGHVFAVTSNGAAVLISEDFDRLAFCRSEDESPELASYLERLPGPLTQLIDELKCQLELQGGSKDNMGRQKPGSIVVQDR